MTMNISEIIKSNTQSLLLIEKELKVIFSLQKEKIVDECLILEKFLFLLEAYKGNSNILKHFLDFIIMCNEDSIVDSYEIDEVDCLFDVLNKVTESDIDILIEHYLFTKNVLDDEPKADKQLKSIKNMIAEKHKYLRKWR
jgi:hypothetical protein